MLTQSVRGAQVRDLVEQGDARQAAQHHMARLVRRRGRPSPFSPAPRPPLRPARAAERQRARASFCVAQTLLSWFAMAPFSYFALNPESGALKTNKTVRAAHRLGGQLTLALSYATCLLGWMTMQQSTVPPPPSPRRTPSLCAARAPDTAAEARARCGPLTREGAAGVARGVWSATRDPRRAGLLLTL